MFTIVLKRFSFKISQKMGSSSSKSRINSTPQHPSGFQQKNHDKKYSLIGDNYRSTDEVTINQGKDS